MSAEHSNKFKICLYDLADAGLIIKTTSSCTYYNQVGGESGEQKQIEGVYLPIDTDEDPAELQNSLKYKLSQLFINSNRVDFKAATAINELMSDCLSTKGISVDLAKLSDSTDSWIHVTVKQTTFSAVQSDQTLTGILTWSNNL